jgi:TolB-like protein
MNDFLTFGPFQIDPARGTLLRDGQSVVVGQRGIALLLALVAAQGQPVTKAALMDQAWPDLAVEEGNLTVQIAQLRKLMGQDAEGRDWIVTVPRVGYRLVLAAPPAPAPPPAPADPRPHLAVLPFHNVGGDAELIYFADGVAADIITALSQFRSIAVVSRNSSFAFRGISRDIRETATALGAGYLLEGSVQRAGQKLRITAQLVEGASGTTLWTQRFDGALDEVFDFQDRITEAVATLVAPAIQASELALSRQRRPERVTSYDIALRAHALIDSETEPDNARALTLLEPALAAEPENGRLTGLAAWALEHRITMGWRAFGPDDVPRSVELARRAISLARGDPRVMAQCAVVLIQTGKDYVGGMAVIEEALRLNPNDLYVLCASGVMATHCGDLDLAVSYCERALRLGPNDPAMRFALTCLAHVDVLRGRYEAAIDHAMRALAINDAFDPSYWMLAAAHAHLGRMQDAQHWRAVVERLSPGVTIARILAAQPARYPDRFAAVAEGLRLAGLPE